MKSQRHWIRALWIAAAGVLIVAIAFTAVAAVAASSSPVAAGSLSPDSTTADRLSRPHWEQPPAGTLALAPTAGQKAAILAASLLLNPILSQLSLPVVIR